MNWLVILPILLKWLDRFGDWIDNISKDVKKKAKINDMDRVSNALNSDDDKYLIDELRKLIDKAEQRKKLS